MTHVDDYWMSSGRDTRAGSGKRRAAPRLPEQARRQFVRGPAHARIQTSAEAADQDTPLYARLAEEWAGRGATVPCRPDPLWQRLVSSEHLRQETSRTLRRLHLASEPGARPPNHL